MTQSRPKDLAETARIEHEKQVTALRRDIRQMVAEMKENGKDGPYVLMVGREIVDVARAAAASMPDFRVEAHG